MNHCRDFIAKTDGVSRLARIIALPCFPYDLPITPETDSLVTVIRTMVEVSPSVTLNNLIKEVRASLDEWRAFWDRPLTDSALCAILEPTSKEFTCF